MKKNIIIIDDSITIRVMLIDTLKKDYNVFDFENGQDALIFLKTNRVDLVITDLHMPKIDGYTLIKEIKKLHKFIPCILLTSDGGAEAIQQSKLAGAATFLTKPFKEDQLRKILRMII